MPLYEYECDACERRFELIRKFSDPPPDVCVLCGSGPVNRLPSSPAIQFKGSGFYITDYAKKGETEKSDKTSTEKTQDAKSDAAAADKGAKAEGKPETAAKTDASGTSDAPVKPASPSTTTSNGSGNRNQT